MKKTETQLKLFRLLGNRRLDFQPFEGVRFSGPPPKRLEIEPTETADPSKGSGCPVLLRDISFQHT